MKPYFQDLKDYFERALEMIKTAEDKEVFMLGCRDAGNYDYLFIIGSDMPGQFQFMHIDYSKMITFDAKEIIDDWFKQKDAGWPEYYDDAFEYSFIPMDELKDHINNYIEHYI